MSAKFSDHERSPVTLDALLEIEKSEQRATNRPNALPLDSLRIADRAFQWRQFDSEFAAEVGHVKELVRVLESNEEPLDPILVTAIGPQFYVVDGHHRVLAYRTAKWAKPVPVVCFEGTVDEARFEALRLNIKNKLPMTTEDKFEAAWILVKEGPTHSKTKISELTTVSLRTVGNMRAVLQKHPEVSEESWKRARALQFGQQTDFDRETWLEEAAKKMAKQIVHNLGPNLTRRPDVLAMALATIDPALPRALVQEWPQAVRAYVEEREEAMGGLDI